MAGRWWAHFDNEVSVEILDTVTGERVKTARDYGPTWWAEGNGSCDCNRRLKGFPALEDAAEAAGEESGCLGCRRFLIVAVEGDMGGRQLWEFNEDYPLDLIEKHLGPEHRRAIEAEDERVRRAIDEAS